MAIPVARLIAQNSRKATGAKNNFVFPEDIGAHGMLLAFKSYDYTSIRNSGSGSDIRPQIESRITDTIVLPLPRNLEDRIGINIRSFDQEFLGDLISQGVSRAEAGVNAGSPTGVMNDMGSFLGGLTPSQDAISNALQGVGNGRMPEDVASSMGFLSRSLIDKVGQGRNVGSALGSIANPKSALSFDGVVMKNHSFTWSFMPRSKNESEQLRNIIDLVRRHSLPSYINISIGANGGSLGHRAMLKFPSVVDIYLLGIDENYYMKFKPCMVTSLNFNFSPQGQAILKGGKPASVDVTIELMETDIWTANDFGEAMTEMSEQAVGAGNPTDSTGYGPR